MSFTPTLSQFVGNKKVDESTHRKWIVLYLGNEQTLLFGASPNFRFVGVSLGAKTLKVKSREAIMKLPFDVC